MVILSNITGHFFGKNPNDNQLVKYAAKYGTGFELWMLLEQKLNGGENE